MSLTLASTILNGIGTGFGLLSAGHNAYSQYHANKNNLSFAKEQFDYQKRLNDLTMSREDNAVQRRVVDLENAGFNKRLAVGASADASSLTAGSASAGQSGANLDPSSAISALTGIVGQIQQIRAGDSQLSIAEKQKNLMDLDTLIKLKESDILTAEEAKRWSEFFLNRSREDEIASKVSESLSNSELNRARKLEQDYRNAEWDKGRHPDRALQSFSVSGSSESRLTGSKSFSASLPADYLDGIIDGVANIISDVKSKSGDVVSAVRSYVKKNWSYLKHFMGIFDNSFDAAVDFLINKANSIASRRKK